MLQTNNLIQPRFAQTRWLRWFVLNKLESQRHNYDTQWRVSVLLEAGVPVRAPVTPNAGQPDPQKAVPSGQFRAFCRRPLKHADLMAQSEVLEFEGSALSGR